MLYQIALSFLFAFVHLFAKNSFPEKNVLKAADYTKKIITLDEEWNINKNRSSKDELPLVVMNIYESYSKNVTKNYFVSSAVRCHFDKTKSSHLGLYTFNLSEYGKNESIFDAEMHMHISYSNIKNTSYLSYDYIVIRTYQIVSENRLETHITPDIHKLLNVVYMPSFRQGWQIFKIKMAVENWLNGEPNLGLLITVNNKREERIYPNFLKSSGGIYRPFLLIYSGVPDNVVKSKKPNKMESNCKKHPWDINLKEIGWDNFIIQPKILNLRRCSGSCNVTATTETTFYTYLYQNYFKYHDKKPKLCCVPSSFSSLPIMFYNTADDVVIKLYRDVIVEYCECR